MDLTSITQDSHTKKLFWSKEALGKIANLSQKLKHSFCFLLRPQVRVPDSFGVGIFDDLLRRVGVGIGVGLRILERRLNRLQVGDTQLDGQLDSYREPLQVLGVFVNAQTRPTRNKQILSSRPIITIKRPL